MNHKTKKPVRTGYAIFRSTFFQGNMPACYDETNYPIAFASELAAQREIANCQLTRIQEFLDGERDFNDAIVTDEFILPVKVEPDGNISTECGRAFGMQK